MSKIEISNFAVRGDLYGDTQLTHFALYGLQCVLESHKDIERWRISIKKHWQRAGIGSQIFTDYQGWVTLITARPVQ